MGSELILPSFDGDACDQETLHIVYAFTSYLKPALIVEAGTYRGHAACSMGSALRNGRIDGEVWTADIEGYDAAVSVAKNGLEAQIKLFRGDFTDMLDGPLKDRSIRMAFIDSGRVVIDGIDVEQEIRSRHIQAVWPRLQVGGIMIVDDVNGNWKNVAGVRETANILLTTGRGMAIVQRR